MSLFAVSRGGLFYFEVCMHIEIILRNFSIEDFPPLYLIFLSSLLTNDIDLVNVVISTVFFSDDFVLFQII